MNLPTTLKCTLTVAVAAALTSCSCPCFKSSSSKSMQASITKSSFGSLPDGTAIEIYTLKNKNGLTAKVMTYGALMTELHAPDQNGRISDITLGFDNLQQYLDGHPYFGATIGRYGNRIAKGRFTLDGKEYTLATNNDPNHLHGGIKGFDKVVWKAEVVPASSGVAVKFSYVSKDGEEGYPGTLTCSVTYNLTDEDELKLDYVATTDKATVVNLTNHTYWNLADAGDIQQHMLMLTADNYTPVDSTLIPTGQITPVKGTVMDFTKPMPIGARINQTDLDPKGYDHNYVLNSKGGKLALAARVEEPKSGRVMEIWTDQPGIQFYSGNFLDGTLKGKGGVVYYKHYGFCLETQHFPDSPNKPNFPSTVLRPGETYATTTVHKFYTR